MTDPTDAPFDVARSAALWPVAGDGDHVARCMYQAFAEHRDHRDTCSRDACVQKRTLELAYATPTGNPGSVEVWSAALANSLLPLMHDFRNQVAEAQGQAPIPAPGSTSVDGLERIRWTFIGVGMAQDEIRRYRHAWLSARRRARRLDLPQVRARAKAEALRDAAEDVKRTGLTATHPDYLARWLEARAHRAERVAVQTGGRS